MANKNRDLHHALSHPTRRRVLAELHGLDKPCSPVRVSEVVDIELPKVGYHMRVLEECGAVKLVDEIPRRGALEHFYVATVSEPWAILILEEAATDETAS